MNNTLLSDLAHIAPTLRFDADSLLEYGRDWSRLHTPKLSAVVFPQTIDHAQKLVGFARAHNIGLVPSGGRTGMSAGAVATQGEIVVSFERMNQILDFDPIAASVHCQAGVITQHIQDFAHEQGLFYPVDFGSRGSSHIGGNIATNAGGIKVIRYGLTRNWVTGLKIVSGRGDVLNLNNGLIKNATGYDLRHLFIGSEGTLGLIVEATLKLTRQAQHPQVMLLGLTDLDRIMDVFGLFQRELELNAFECFSDRCLRYVLAKGGQAPFDRPAEHYVLIEFDNTSEQMLEHALNLFEAASADHGVIDGVISSSDTQARTLWALRENITESIAEFLPYKNDISVPVGTVARFLRTIDDLFARQYPDFEVLCFGHVGDGNIHVNVLKPPHLEQAQFIEQCEQVNQLLFAVVQDFGGSISAEHGVGLTKKAYLNFTRDAVEVDYLRALKQVFDPDNIMNPGKIFD